MIQKFGYRKLLVINNLIHELYIFLLIVEKKNCKCGACCRCYPHVILETNHWTNLSQIDSSFVQTTSNIYYNNVHILATFSILSRLFITIIQVSEKYVEHINYFYWQDKKNLTSAKLFIKAFILFNKKILKINNYL